MHTMASLAAVVLPSSRFDQLPAVQEALARALAPFGVAENRLFSGRDRCALLLRTWPSGGAGSAPCLLPGAGAQAVTAGYWCPPPGGSGLTLHDAARREPQSLTNGQGVYAFARFDPASEELVAGVDPLGMRPLYWADLPGGGCVVASEVKAVLAAGVAPRPCWGGIEEMHRLGYLLDDLTLFEGVRRVGPGEILTFGHRGLARTGGDRIKLPHPAQPLDELEWQAAAARALESAVRTLLGQVPTARPLLAISGGLDSRRLLAALLAIGVQPALFTVGARTRSNCAPDLEIAREVAAWAGLPLEEIQPPADLTRMLTYRDLMADFETDEHSVYAQVGMTGPRTGVVGFDGLAGDTLHNPGRFVLPKDVALDDVPEAILVLEAPDPGWLELPPTVPDLRERISEVWSRYRDLPSPLTRFALHTRGRRELSLGPLVLQEPAFPSYLPYLDREVVSLALSVPPERKRGRLLQRELIAAHGYPELAALRSTRDPAAVPDQVLRRPSWLGLKRRGEMLAATLRPLGAPAGRVRWSTRAKFAIVALAGGLVPEASAWWQSGKLRDFDTWGRFFAASRSRSGYLDACAAARGDLA